MQDLTYKKLYMWIKGTNTVLSVLIFVFAFYLFIDPIIPEFAFQFQKLASSFAKPAYAATNPAVDTTKLEGTRLIIPKINLDKEIIEAQSIKDVHEKVWRRPNGSTPERGGNTVLIAHRYATIGGLRESTFYNLPNLENGDLVTVVTKGKSYTYKVFSTKIVPPTEVKIEFNTEDPILTLYTCTPLWSGTNRFVVSAKLVDTTDASLAANL